MRKLVRKIRTGQVDCNTRQHQWGALPNHSMACPCGAPIQDQHHVVLECPTYGPARAAVLDTIKAHAASDSQLASLINGHSELSILLASLGAPLPGPWKLLVCGPYSTLVGLAGPIWSKGLHSLL